MNVFCYSDIIGLIIDLLNATDFKSMRLVSKSINNMMLSKFNNRFMKIVQRDIYDYRTIKDSIIPSSSDNISTYRWIYNNISSNCYIKTDDFKVEFTANEKNEIFAISIRYNFDITYLIRIGSYSINERNILVKQSDHNIIRQSFKFTQLVGYNMIMPDLWTSPDNYDLLKKIKTLYHLE